MCMRKYANTASAHRAIFADRVKAEWNVTKEPEGVATNHVQTVHEKEKPQTSDIISLH